VNEEIKKSHKRVLAFNGSIRRIQEDIAYWREASENGVTISISTENMDTNVFCDSLNSTRVKSVIDVVIAQLQEEIERLESAIHEEHRKLKEML
jgi:uncharacterized small protein (DUF1192 family)